MQTNIRSGRQRVLDDALLMPKVYYFCFYAAMASLIPYLALYYRQIGLSDSQIGLLTGVGPLVTLFAAPVWGGVADATQRHKRLLLMAIAGTMAMMVVLYVSTQIGKAQFVWILPIVTIYAVFFAPLVPLVDNSVMALLGERKAQYGRLRMWGAVGWGISGMTAGMLIQSTGIRTAFFGFWLFMGGCLAAASLLSIRPSHIGGKFWQGLRTLATERRWMIFLLVVLLAGIANGMINNFLFLYMQDLNATETLMGLSLLVATASELPVFFYSDRLLARWNARGLLLISLSATFVRLIGYILMPAAWVVLPLHILHGFTFSALWVAGVSYANEIAPERLGATAQGLFGGVTMGLGAAGGAIIGGLLYQGMGPVSMYGWGALGVAVAFGLLFLFGQPTEQAETYVENL